MIEGLKVLIKLVLLQNCMTVGTLYRFLEHRHRDHCLHIVQLKVSELIAVIMFL